MKSFNKKYAATAVLVSMTLGLGAYRFLHSSSILGATGSSSAAENVHAAEQNATATRPVVLPARQWQEGASFIYDIDTTRSMAITGLSQAEQVVKYHVQGTLRLTVMGREGDDIRLRVDVEATNVELVPAGKMSEKEAAIWLSRTFYAHARVNGEIPSFFFPKDVPVEARILLKGFVNSLQWVSPSGPVATWHTVEQDVSGQYDAKYRAVDGFSVEKSKVNYLQMRVPTGLKPIQRGTEYGVSSSATFGLDGSGWPKTLLEDESVEVKTQGTTVVGTIQTTAKLSAIETHLEWTGAFAADLENDVVSEAAAMALSMKQADINQVGGKSLRDLTTDVNSTNSKMRNHAQAKLAALMRIEPARAKEVTDEILHGTSDTNAKKRLIGALGTAGTPEAQRELAKILEMTEAGDLRVNAGVAMSMTKHPTEGTADALEKAMHSPDKKIDNTATLALGNVVRSMNNDGAGETADELKVLIDGLANASSDMERKVYLEALGNSGDTRAFVAISSYLTHQNVTLRAAATGALKFMPGAVADTAIIAAFSDSELAVRNAAAHTIGFRPISTMLGAIDTVLRTETVVAIRLEMLKGMHMKVKEDPGVIDCVAWAMENDSSPKIRAFAKSIVDNVNADLL